MTAVEILTKAAGHMQDRVSTYDKPEGERSMAQTVAIFNLYHGAELTEAQGWHLLQILKDVRLFTRPGYHADSAEDCVAYAALKAEALAAPVKCGPFPSEGRQDAEDVTIWPPDDCQRQQRIEQNGELAEIVYPALDALMPTCGGCGALHGYPHTAGCLNLPRQGC